MSSNATVHPNLVRAWFDTVLNPLIQRLSTEAAFLAERNLTWRIQPRRLVSFAPVRDHLAHEVWDNYEQFLSIHPQCIPPIEEHDSSLHRLSEACLHLEAALTHSKALQLAFDRAILTLPPGREVSEYFAEPTPEDYLRVVAAHIINSVGELPASDPAAPVWNKHRDAFVAARETDEVQPCWTATEEAAGQFLAAVNTLRDTLKTLRNDLSLAAGVPIVERAGGAA